MTNSSNVNKQGDSLFTKDQVALEIMHVETENKLNKYINLNDNNTNLPTTSKSKSTIKNDEWNLVTRTRRKRQVIVGNNKESSLIKGVPKLAALHVYRVDKNTTSDELTTLLTSNFQELKCEKIISKHPEIYSSFKVTILEEDFGKAMNAEVWPYVACVSRFLEMRKKVTIPAT